MATEPEDVLAYDTEFEDLEDAFDEFPDFTPEALAADAEAMERARASAWWPHDEVEADRLLARIERLQSLRAEAVALYEAEIARFRGALEDRKARFDAKVERLARRLCLYHTVEREREKTVILPHGELQFTVRKPAVLGVTDEDRALDILSADAADFERFATVKTRLNWGALKKTLELTFGESGVAVVRKDTGEVLPFDLFEIRGGETREWRFSIGRSRTKTKRTAEGADANDDDDDDEGK